MRQLRCQSHSDRDAVLYLDTKVDEAIEIAAKIVI
jgi:hypothetical protein